MTGELRVVDQSLLIRGSTPTQVAALLVHGRLGFAPYDGADLLEVATIGPSPEGHARFRYRWASASGSPVEVVAETFVSKLPHHLAARTCDTFGEVIRYDYVLTAVGHDTEFRLRAALEHESSAPRNSQARHWINDRLMGRAVGMQLGRIRHEFELRRS